MRWAAATVIVIVVAAAIVVLFRASSGGSLPPIDAARAKAVAVSATSDLGWWPPRSAYPCATVEACRGTGLPDLDRHRWTDLSYLPFALADERAFLNVSPVPRRNGVAPADPFPVRPGQQVRVVEVVDDSASGGSIHRAAATGVRGSILLPTGCRRQQEVLGLVSDTNVDHAEQITDTATLVSTRPICLAAVPGTSKFQNDHKSFVLPAATVGIYDSSSIDRRVLVQIGPLLGCAKLDGRLPATFDCSGYVSVVVAVVSPGQTPDLHRPAAQQ